MDWRDRLADIVIAGMVLFDEPMSRHTTFRIGGPADALVLPGTGQELRDVIDFARAEALPWLVIGRGSNLLVRDGGLRGLAVKTSQCLRGLEFEGGRARVGAGLSLAELAGEAARRSLAGLAFAAGIPGTVGGAVYMNAGAYGGELAQVVAEVTVYLPGEGDCRLARSELGFAYRSSRFQREDSVILEAVLELTPGDEAAIREEMAVYTRKRQEKQPLHLPSAGSVFRRPPGGYAGTLIEAAGLKGRRIGDAQVSEMHANFIVNLGRASASDVLALIDLIRREVREKTGFLLEPEVRVIGEDL